MKLAGILFISFLIAINCQAQKSKVMHLWSGTVPGENEAKHPAKVSPDSSGGVIRLTDVTDPIVMVYAPKADNNRHIGVVVCPGGAYRILAINKEGTRIAKWLTENGYTAFVLQYRVPNKQAGALQDVQRAIRVIRSKAKKYKIDKNKLGVMGFSAGGSLSARISTEYDHDWYKSIDQADSLSAKPDFTLLIYPAYLDKGPNHSLTPELKVNRATTPPMFIFQAADDPYGNSSLVMASALRKAKVPVEMHLYPKGGHGFGMEKENPAAQAWPPLALKWLTQTTVVHKLDLYLLIGQSNMAGRAIIGRRERDTLRHVYLFNGTTFVPAANPLNKYSTVRKRLSIQGVNPGYSFGKEVAELSGKNIGLVVNPRGGTKIEWWEKGYKGPNDFNLYENAMKQIKKAEQYGTLKAIIWHQGESNQSNPQDYMALLKKLVKSLRHDLGGNFYFVAGEIGKWRQGPEKINKVIDEIPKEIPNADYVNTNGLTPLHGDSTNPHFDRRSQLILGQRYALKVLSKIYHIDLCH